jgi:hypothetical protein
MEKQPISEDGGDKQGEKKIERPQYRNKFGE